MGFLKKGKEIVKGILEKKDASSQDGQDKDAAESASKELAEMVRKNNVSGQKVKMRIEGLRTVLSGGNWPEEERGIMDGLLVGVQNKLDGTSEAMWDVQDLDKAALTLIDRIEAYCKQNDAEILQHAINALVNNLCKVRFSEDENEIAAGTLDLEYASLLVQRADITRNLENLQRERDVIIHRLEGMGDEDSAIEMNQAVASERSLKQQIVVYTSRLDSLNAQIVETETLRTQYSNLVQESLDEEQREKNRRLTRLLSEKMKKQAKLIEDHNNEIIDSVVHIEHDLETIERVLPGRSMDMVDVRERVLNAYRQEQEKNAGRQTEQEALSYTQSDSESNENQQLHV